MKLTEYVGYDGLGLAELVRTREVTSSELAEVASRAIAAVNPEICAVVEVYDDRIESIREPSLGNGRFGGVPFLIKDDGSFEAGRKCEQGSRLLRDNVSSDDAFFIELVRASGLNNIGRTNVPEFCIANTTENVLYGNTSNPWRLGYSAGGSSGGAAAAVVAGLVPIAHGSDSGGSIRTPASLCGCVGLKPSRGRVSLGPQAAEETWGMSTHLVETRTVRDTAAMLDQLGAPQPGDPFVIRQPDRPYLEYVGAPTGTLRIAFSVDSLMLDHPVNPETAVAVRHAAILLEEMGHSVVEAAPPYQIEQAIGHCRNVYRFGFARSVEALAEVKSTTVGPDNLEPCTLAIYESSKKMGSHVIIDALSYYNEVRRGFGRFFEQFDIWLTPTTAQPAEPWGRYGQNLEGVSAEEYSVLADSVVQFCIPYNVTGFPSISLPLFETSDALPIGIQLGTRHGEEETLIRLASTLEEARPWIGRVPPIHASRY
jgi:amidase